MEVQAGGSLSFKALLDDTCDRLWALEVKYSIYRIESMVQTLDLLEKELSELISPIAESSPVRR
jgi:hypothetical protein